jgi:predicted RNA-binding Zn ribbon-like protein
MTMNNSTINLREIVSIEAELCLEFANTAEARERGNSSQFMDYDGLISWGRSTGALTPADAEGLAREASRRPVEASVAAEGAIALREALYRLFRAVVEGDSPDTDDLEILNAALAEAQIKRLLVYTPRGFGWEWAPSADNLDKLTWLAALSAADLLNSDQLGMVKRCAADDCAWLFVDTTRNHSRLWCSMGACGNRAKVRRFYKRNRAQNTDDENSTH